MPIISQLKALLTSDTGDFTADMKDAADSARQFNKDVKETKNGAQQGGQAISGLQKTVTNFLTAGALYKAGEMLIDFGRESVAAAEDAAQAQAQLEAVIRSTGGVAGVTAGDVGELSGALMDLTGVEDDLITRNAAVMLTFTKIGRDVFPDAMAAALDMSAALGQDLQSSVVQLGKALNDPIEGVSALRRVGVSFTEDQQDMIASLVESGKLLDAQQYILAELQTEFGGTAEAIHEAGSQSDTLANSVGNLKEEFGKGLLPAIRDTNIVLAEWADSVTDALVHQNLLNEAVQVGLLTEEERAQFYATAARGMINRTALQSDLTERMREYNEEMQLATDREARFAQRFQEITPAAEEAAEGISQTSQAMEEYVKNTQRAQQETRDWLGELDTGIASTIGKMMDELAFAMAGGGELQAAAEGVKTALLEGKITETEAQSYWQALFVEAQQLQVELGNIDVWEAAKNIQEQLNIPLQEALDLVRDIKQEGKFNIKSTITVDIKYNRRAAGREDWTDTAWGGSGRAGGGPVTAGVAYPWNEPGAAPEVLIPAGNGFVLNRKQAEDALAGAMGGMTINLGGVTVSGNQDPQSAYLAGMQIGEGVISALRAKGLR